MDIVTGAITTAPQTSSETYTDPQSETINQILNLASRDGLGAVIVDIDGTLGTLQPGLHTLPGAIDAAPALITLAQFIPTGPLTGRPHKVVETGMAGLLDQKFGFAGTEAGARLVRGHEVVYERGIPEIEHVKARIQGIVDLLPNAFVEDHTNCSIIVGLTKVSAIYHDEAFDKLNAILKDISTDDAPIGAVTGRKVDINVHFNFVREGIDKGVGTKEIYDLFQINKPTVVCGDDAADKPMFEVAKERGGFTIGVGSKAPQADVHFEHPGQMVDFLNDLAKRYAPNFG